MKHLPLISVLMLAGCVSAFDPIEHSHTVNLQFLANKKVCDDVTDARTRSKVIAIETDWLVIYTGARAKNTDLHRATKELDQIAQQMSARYEESPPPSRAYCEIKMDVLKQGATTLVQMSGGKI
jgi:outer membrane murein-binding lipoprotein Lpp